MEHFCIVTNADKDHDYRMSRYIMSYLSKHNKSCVLVQDSAQKCGGVRAGDMVCDKNEQGEKLTSSVPFPHVTPDELPADTDCAIILGGDGTFIQAAIALAEYELPLLGVNIGTLGFLTEVEPQGLAPALAQLIRDDCRIENRLMLQGFADGINGRLALNDIVITKRGAFRMVTTRLFINNELVETYLGDGVIISTPTGSTAYNLSAGGPVMSPQVQAIIITPICPHSLNKRSLVVSAEDELRIEIGQGKSYLMDEAIAIFDGQVTKDLSTGDNITITKAKKSARIVKFENSFFRILRNKL